MPVLSAMSLDAIAVLCLAVSLGLGALAAGLTTHFNRPPSSSWGPAGSTHPPAAAPAPGSRPLARSLCGIGLGKGLLVLADSEEQRWVCSDGDACEERQGVGGTAAAPSASLPALEASPAPPPTSRAPCARRVATPGRRAMLLKTAKPDGRR